MGAPFDPFLSSMLLQGKVVSSTTDTYRVWGLWSLLRMTRDSLCYYERSPGGGCLLWLSFTPGAQINMLIEVCAVCSDIKT